MCSQFLPKNSKLEKNELTNYLKIKISKWLYIFYKNENIEK